MADSTITLSAPVVVPGVKQNVVSWSAANGSCLPYMGLAVVEVWSHTANNRAGATKVGEVLGTQFTHAGLTIGVTRWYWIQAVDVSGNRSDFSPLSATGGVAGTPTSTGTNSVTADELAPNSVTNADIVAGAVTADKVSVVSLEALSATLGNVTINGNLVVNGTISTGKVANNAISGTSDASDATERFMIASTEVVLCTFTPTMVGGQALVDASAVLRGLSSFAAPRIQFRLKRNGVTVKVVERRAINNVTSHVAINYTDPSAGTSGVTWQIVGYGIDSDSGEGLAGEGYIRVANLKK